MQGSSDLAFDAPSLIDAGTALKPDQELEASIEAGAIMVEEQTAADPSLQKKPATKRLCRFPGCQRVIKSQGHCQRHGAKTKRCKVEGCDKQAQGTHEGMCKRHWKEINVAKPVQEPEAPIEMAKPEGESVYDTILPQSISFRPAVQGQPVTDRIMPLVAFLRSNAKRCELGWHRQAERRARGLPPAGSLANQLEPWERQLALVEILLLSGGTPKANFKDLAYAWGRDKNFHQNLTNTVFQRRGEVERKRRIDAVRSSCPLAAVKKLRPDQL